MREFKGDWRDLFFGFRVALDLRKIFLSFVGLIFSLALILPILGVGVAYDKDEFKGLVEEWEIADATRMIATWTSQTYITPVKKVILHPLSSEGFFFPTETEDEAEKGRRRAKVREADKSPTKIEETVKARWTWPVTILLACILWLILVWSKLGGAITRIAAVEVAKDERITTHEALQFSKKKYSSYFWSPVSVLIAFLFFYFMNALGGLVGQIPYLGPVLVGILSFLAFLGAFVMLLIAIGGIFGWPLMSPAVSAEGTDAFDAVSRSFSYVYSRPWQYVYYWLVTGVYGLVSVGFIWVFTLLLVKLTFHSVQFGMGDGLDTTVKVLFSFGGSEPAPTMGVTNGIMTVLVGTMVVLLYGLGFSYAISFLYSSRTLMYFILRKRVDNTEMNEVYLEEDDEDLFEDEIGFEEGKGDETPSSDGESKADEGGEKKADKECAEGEEKPDTKPETEGKGSEPEKRGEEPAAEEKKGEPDEKNEESGS
ncbi:MAG: MFS transporter [Planctomycetota bacterium]|jgi:hypothetical protein